MLITTLLQKGAYLEGCGILLPWGSAIHDLARALNLSMSKESSRLEIGDHQILNGLFMKKIMAGNTDYKEKPFNLLYGRVSPLVLDFLSEKFEVNLQPTRPQSTTEGEAQMCWQKDGIELSFSAINVRGEGSFEHVLTIRHLKIK